MIIYGAIAIIIYYLTYRYVPNELIENMLSLVVRDMNNGIICYDRKGRCIYYNTGMAAICLFMKVNIVSGLKSWEMTEGTV